MSQNISVYVGPFVAVSAAPVGSQRSLSDMLDDELYAPDIRTPESGLVVLLPNRKRPGSGRTFSEDSKAGVTAIAYGDREKEIAQFEDSFEQILGKLRALPGVFVKVQWGLATYWS